MSDFKNMSKESAELYLEFLIGIQRGLLKFDKSIFKEFGVCLCGLTNGVHLYKGIKNLSDALGVEPVMSSLDEYMKISLYYKGVEVFEIIGSKEELIEEGLYTEED